MGIVSSTFASLAIRLAWNCQRLLDPQYNRCVEGKRFCELSPPPASPRTVVAKTPSVSVENNNSAHQENRNRRAAQLRYRRRRPSSFDTALIARRNDNTGSVHLTCVTTSTPSPLRRPPPQIWDVTTSSGCSSDSGSDLDSDSEVDERLNEAFRGNVEDAEEDKEFSMSAAEEAALRLTVGRGHFSRTKKDKFLNHLRLEKRLNDLNNTFCGLTYSSEIRNKERRYSGELHRVVF